MLPNATLVFAGNGDDNVPTPSFLPNENRTSTAFFLKYTLIYAIGVSFAFVVYLYVPGALP